MHLSQICDNFYPEKAKYYTAQVFEGMEQSWFQNC